MSGPARQMPATVASSDTSLGPSAVDIHVYLVPVGGDRYELYCETPDLVESAAADRPSSGWLRGLWDRFEAAIAASGDEKALDETGDDDGWMGRMKRWGLGWIAERVAEQRLLWHLRRTSAAMLVHPTDVTADEAHRIRRDSLQHDADRHLRWLFVDSLVLILTGAFAIIPGPNLIAYYFAFRVVGHWLSWRGARHGLGRVRWFAQASDPLGELRAAIELDPAARDVRVDDVAARLDLPRLGAFVRRIACRAA